MDALRVSGLLQAQEQAGHQGDPRPHPTPHPMSTPAQRRSTHRLEARRAPNAITESMSTSATRRAISASTESRQTRPLGERTRQQGTLIC